MSKKGKYCWGWYKQRWREVAPFMLVPDSQFVLLLCLHFQISFFIYRKVCYSPHIASESGGDWFVVEVACDLESYAVVSFHITGTILHGSIQFPVIYISKYKKIWNFPVSHQRCYRIFGRRGKKKKRLRMWHYPYSLSRSSEDVSHFSCPGLVFLQKLCMLHKDRWIPIKSAENNLLRENSIR